MHFAWTLYSPHVTAQHTGAPWTRAAVSYSISDAIQTVHIRLLGQLPVPLNRTLSCSSCLQHLSEDYRLTLYSVIWTELWLGVAIPNSNYPGEFRERYRIITNPVSDFCCLTRHVSVLLTDAEYWCLRYWFIKCWYNGRSGAGRQRDGQHLGCNLLLQDVVTDCNCHFVCNTFCACTWTCINMWMCVNAA